MSVRIATAGDLAQLAALGRVMHAEAPAFRHAAFNEAKVLGALELSMSQGPLFVHEGERGEIDGGFAGVVMERWFSTDRVVIDLGLFVRPDQRGGLTAHRLLQQFLLWCREQAFAPADVVIGVATGVHIEQTGRLYEGVGFRRVGGIYQLRSY